MLIFVGFIIMQGKIDNLQKELQMYRDALTRQVCHKCTHMVERPDDAVSLATFKKETREVF
jgi:hypothetical protein